MYQGLKDPRTGAQLYPGLAPGSEPFWPNRDPANPFPIPIGPNTFDMQAVLEQWVEHGTAPERIIATRSVNGIVDRTRPLCPYPQQAFYKGSGDTNDAASFVCKTP